LQPLDILFHDAEHGCIHQATTASSKKQDSGYFCTSKDPGRHLRVSQNEFILMPQGFAAKLKNCMYYLISFEWSCWTVWHWTVWRSKKEGFIWDLQLTVLLWHTMFLSFVKILLYGMELLLHGGIPQELLSKLW
jgi:hypothetical protein